VVVQWTSIPCKLKILKLFIKELGNITEGEDTFPTHENGETHFGGGGGAMENGTEWEDEDDGSSEDDDWEDLGSGSNDPDDSAGQDDILKGINTKVSPPLKLRRLM
jgi:hypothetical protein